MPRHAIACHGICPVMSGHIPWHARAHTVECHGICHSTCHGVVLKHRDLLPVTCPFPFCAFRWSLANRRPLNGRRPPACQPFRSLADRRPAAGRPVAACRQPSAAHWPPSGRRRRLPAAAGRCQWPAGVAKMNRGGGASLLLSLGGEPTMFIPYAALLFIMIRIVILAYSGLPWQASMVIRSRAL